MRILVTGATGGLGRNATQYLLSQGVDVIATGRNVAIGQELSDRGARFVGIDLARPDPKLLASMVDQADAVWHCAAFSAPWGAPGAFDDCNVKATANLLDAAGQAGIARFVHVSTPAIYFDFTHRYDVPESFRARTPVNHYARSKAAAEDKVNEASASYPAMHTSIIRPRAIFGPHDQVLVPRLSRVIRANGGRLTLPRGGRTMLDLTYVDNVVHAMWLATTNKNMPSGLAFNITNNEPVHIADMLEKLFVCGMKTRLSIQSLPYSLLAAAASLLEGMSAFSGREPPLTKYSVGVLAFDMTLSLKRAIDVLGYSPKISLDEGIERTAHWLRRHG
ncbi:Nucleoside-diphosphate-sugar epimerase [Noviherbaspirillum humi]|uniref:Nucleoside-diphosphate-sugar epimerase n=1 Tax=Noviherbaspirillum humi TaxID=1688639 RepID=A0A239FA59_9BURK|nr:NAD(P)-dependent oxidoreductase [Noviherbaspirillum humi]SNS53796.1 Nucleoside-diphosphate-sugar epimerase [Noviherbaspirillum humi]